MLTERHCEPGYRFISMPRITTNVIAGSEKWLPANAKLVAKQRSKILPFIFKTQDCIVRTGTTSKIKMMMM